MYKGKNGIFSRFFVQIYHNNYRGTNDFREVLCGMKKVFKHYILSEKEMDKINYLLDLYRKYKVMAELHWEEPEGQGHEEDFTGNL